MGAAHGTRTPGGRTLPTAPCPQLELPGVRVGARQESAVTTHLTPHRRRVRGKASLTLSSVWPAREARGWRVPRGKLRLLAPERAHTHGTCFDGLIRGAMRCGLVVLGGRGLLEVHGVDGT